MNIVATYLILVLAAALEAGGDALIRCGLRSPALATRIGFLAAGTLVLLAYGVAVNTPAWDFGKLLGLYVTLFFAVAQVINLVVFHVRPDGPLLVGGTFIVAGGLIIAFWRA